MNELILLVFPEDFCHKGHPTCTEFPYNFTGKCGEAIKSNISLACFQALSLFICEDSFSVHCSQGFYQEPSFPPRSPPLQHKRTR